MNKVFMHFSGWDKMIRKGKIEAAGPEDQPGYYIRRLQQIAVAIFFEETQDHGITPVQYAALYAAISQPGLDQRTLASTIGFDTSTIGGVIDRLESRGLIERRTLAGDRRVRLLHATNQGQSLVEAIIPAMLRAQQRILEPLPVDQRPGFMSMLKVLVQGHDGC